jgi:histidinol-phosphate aminotransferase
MDFWDESILVHTADYDNLIVLKTCSKAIGLAALRLGFAVAGRRLTDALRAVKSPYNTDTVSQVIGGAALSEKALLRKMRDEIVASRDSLYAGLSALEKEFPELLKVYVPKTNFVFIETPYSGQIHSRLLKESIAVRGLEDGLRVTAGAEDENAAFLAAMKNILIEVN